jgi:hypothetical protein
MARRTMRIMPPITPPTAPPTIAPTFFEEDDPGVAAGVVELVVDADDVDVTELELAGRVVKGGVLGAAVASAPDPWSANEMVGWGMRVIRDA